MKCLLYFGITSMKQGTSAHLSGRGELHRGARVITLVTLRECTSNFKENQKCLSVSLHYFPWAKSGASAWIKHPKIDMVVTFSHFHPPLGQACPQLGPLTGPDAWGSILLDCVTIPLSVLRMSVCVSRHSPAWPQRAAFTDVRPKVLISYYDHSYGAQFLCWPLSFW